MKQESKKTAIITGSGRGIGKETAIMLAYVFYHLYRNKP
jgi:NAD(P)-dependent dehydrogenase (short-subunit alcohol dehydrogenase family)